MARIKKKHDCKSCRAYCCMIDGYVDTDKDEREIISKRLKTPVSELFNRNGEIKKNSCISPCPFLNVDFLCSIYDIRPSICREYNCKAYLESPQLSGVWEVKQMLDK